MKRITEPSEYNQYLVWFDIPNRDTNPKFGYALGHYSDDTWELENHDDLVPHEMITDVWELPKPGEK